MWFPFPGISHLVSHHHSLPLPYYTNSYLFYVLFYALICLFWEAFPENPPTSLCTYFLTCSLGCKFCGDRHCVCPFVMSQMLSLVPGL